MISPLIKNQSPYKILFKHALDFSFLKLFGCLCYPYLRPYTTHKLNTRFEWCVFINYSLMHLGYWYLSLHLGKIFISRDVLFNEIEFPYQNLLENFDSSSSSMFSSILSLSLTIVYLINCADIVCSSSPYLFVYPQHSNEILDTSQHIQTDSSIDFVSSSLVTSLSIIQYNNTTSSSSLHASNIKTLVKIKFLADIYSQTQPITNLSQLTTKHHLPASFLTSVSQAIKPTCFTQASKDPNWNKAMISNFKTLLKNNT